MGDEILRPDPLWHMLAALKNGDVSLERAYEYVTGRQELKVVIPKWCEHCNGRLVEQPEKH